MNSSWSTSTEAEYSVSRAYSRQHTWYAAALPTKGSAAYIYAMNKLLGFFILLVALVGGYLAWAALGNSDELAAVDAPREMRAPELGFEFSYPRGFVLVEREPSGQDDRSLQHIYTLMLEEEYEDLVQSIEPREGPPAIVVMVFTNDGGMLPRAWADSNAQYSNIALISGDAMEAYVGGAPAIRYMADGLYTAETYVIAHGGFIYLVAGQFMDENSAMRRDFAPFVDSIEFIQ